MLPDIYNFNEINEILEVEEIEETFKEYAYDFINNKFIYEDGKIKIVEGLEAIKIWIAKTLLVERFKYLGYSDNYGHEIESLTGNIMSREALESESKRLLEECLFENSFIESITNVEVQIKNSRPIISATINTVFGEVSV